MKTKAVLKKEVKHDICEIGTFRDFYNFLVKSNDNNSTALAVDRSNGFVYSIILSHVDGSEYVVYNFDQLKYIGIVSSPFGVVKHTIDKDNFKYLFECFDFYLVDDSDLVKFLNK